MVHPEQSRKDRRWFLGAAGKTMAAAFGVAALGAATPAYADRGVHQKGGGKTTAQGETQNVTYRCCLNCDTCGCSTCGSLTRYYCRPNSSACAPFCTSCRTNIGNCYNITSGC